MITPPSLFGMLALAAVLTSAPAQAQEEMRAISFIPKNHALMAMANEWVERVNDELSDELEVDFVGGLEVIPRFSQDQAIRTGIIDIIFASTGDFPDQLPEGRIFTLSKLTPSEERESGFYDDMVDRFAETLNVRYLGRALSAPFYLWTKTEPESLEDLQGLKMRTGALYDAFMRDLGMVPVSIDPPEVYTALKSGIVDGFGWPVIGPLSLGWLEDVDYVVDLPFFGASNVVILMNLDEWNALSPETQDKLIELTADFEKDMVAHFEQVSQEEWDRIGDQVKRVTFSEEENKRYLEAADRTEWEALGERVPAERVEELRELIGN